MGKMFKRKNGESMPQFIARCRNEQAAAGRVWYKGKLKLVAKPKRKSRAISASNKVADRIDGMDRDDLGFSPDY